MAILPALAQSASPLDSLGPAAGDGGGFVGENLFVLFGLLLGILALLFLAVRIRYSMRNRRKRRKSRSREQKRIKPQASITQTPPQTRSRSGRKRRASKRNPTLAETGGLPPARPEGQAPPEPKP